MGNNALIKAVTDVDLPFEITEPSVLNEIIAKKPSVVSERQLVSSEEILISYKFANCQAIALLGNRIGALAHNVSGDNPQNSLTGERTNKEERREDPRIIFPNRNNTLAFHIYLINNYQWSEQIINEALKQIRINHIYHLPIKSRVENHPTLRNVALDVPQRKLYIFPIDFDYGICLPIDKIVRPNT